MSDYLKSNEGDTTKVEVQLSHSKLDDLLNESEGGISEEVRHMLIQTAMRTILFQINSNYREELVKILGSDKIDEDGNILALNDSEIPTELFEFICDKIMGYVPNIDIEITNGESND